jgi:hypothetical protein
MSKMKSLSISLSFAALAAAAPAFADVDAQELWAEWQAQIAATGQTMTTESVTETADGLVISGLTTTNVQADVTSTGSIDQVTLTENADGTVSVEMSEVYRLRTQTDAGTGPAFDVSMEMRHQGLEVTVSGTPAARQYDYSADSMIFTTEQITVDGESEGMFDLDFTISDLVAQYLFEGADVDDVSFTSTSELGGVTGTIDAAAPDGEAGNFKLSFNMGATTSSGSGTLGSMAALSQMSSGGVLPEEFDLEGQASYDRLSYEMTFEDPTTSFNMAFANEGGDLGVAFGPSGLTYDLSSENVTSTVQTSEFPLPIEVSAASAAFLLTIPMMPEPEPSDMALQLNYQELTVNDALWGMIDPGAAIPRDPATLVLDVTGQVQMLVNLMAGDPSAFQGPPGELRDVTLNELEVSVAGASLTGDGDLDFAPGQMIPQPVGAIDLQLSGANALIERLVGAGLLPAQQAAMFQGMAGMFARPGAAPDTLETTIDFLPGGGITANGVPLQ